MSPRRRTPPLLELAEVDAFYGPIQALRAVSITVGKGERVALVGTNGAGKTTTLRVISGLLQPRGGEVFLDGKPIGGKTPDIVVAQGVAHVPEGRELFASMSVEDNLRAGFWPVRHTNASYKDHRERAVTYFPILRDRAGQAAGTLSGGEQQMLVIARALMSNPRLLLIDELSLGLAPKIVAQIYEILGDVSREGTSLLIVEQFVHKALANTDRAYLLAKGEVVLADASDKLLADPQLVAGYLGGDGSAASEPVTSARARRSGGRSSANDARTSV